MCGINRIAALQAALRGTSFNPGRCPGLLQFQPFGLNLSKVPTFSPQRGEIATAQGNALGTKGNPPSPACRAATLELFSPAKINLFLRVLGKRPDGYHELATLIQTIDLGDTLTFTLSTQDQLTCSDPYLPCNASNLIIKALTLFRRKTNLHTPITIHLEKKIPIQAGLGGGSSNAATTLWALNTLHNNPCTTQELQNWSAEIGSDVPFFFSHGTAYCTGRGEQVRNLPPPTLPSLSLIKPNQGLSTPTIFNALHLHECSLEDPEKLLSDFYKGNPSFINDLETSAFRLCPALSQIKKKHPTSFMSGSGSAMICPEGQGFSFCLVRRTEDWYKKSFFTANL